MLNYKVFFIKTKTDLKSKDDFEPRSSGLTFPLFFGAMRKVRILSTRSEWVPFFSRSKTPQTAFSLVLVKFVFLHRKELTSSSWSLWLWEQWHHMMSAGKASHVQNLLQKFFPFFRVLFTVCVKRKSIKQTQVLLYRGHLMREQTIIWCKIIIKVLCSTALCFFGSFVHNRLLFHWSFVLMFGKHPLTEPLVSVSLGSLKVIQMFVPFLVCRTELRAEASGQLASSWWSGSPCEECLLTYHRYLETQQNKKVGSFFLKQIRRSSGRFLSQVFIYHRQSWASPFVSGPGNRASQLSSSPVFPQWFHQHLQQQNDKGKRNWSILLAFFSQ